MPELPEVETVANGVNARIRGQRIIGAWFSDKPEPMKTAPAEMERLLTGARIDRVHRVGKTVVFDLTRSRGETAQWLVHLGMTGRLLVNDSALEKPAHTHGVLSLSSGRELRFVDPRRFGRMSIHGMEGPDLGRAGPKKRVAGKPLPPAKRPPPTADAGAHAAYSGSGAEPLSIGMKDFADLFRGRQTPIKSALLNQKLLHGVGNIYADEALFRAGVRPARRAARVTRAEMERLRVGLVEVLRQAIALGGSSVSDYVDAEGAKGFFQLEHRVYQRTGGPCLVCGTVIQRKVIGGRSSHFCPACQK